MRFYIVHKKTTTKKKHQFREMHFTNN